MDVIIKFLREGTFGDISIGATFDEVRQVFGKPEDTLQDCPELWLAKYYSLEFVFQKDILYMINVVILDGKFCFPNQINRKYKTKVNGKLKIEKFAEKKGSDPFFAMSEESKRDTGRPELYIIGGVALQGKIGMDACFAYRNL
jgi:hypothetical protein